MVIVRDVTLDAGPAYVEVRATLYREGPYGQYEHFGEITTRDTDQMMHLMNWFRSGTRLSEDELFREQIGTGV